MTFPRLMASPAGRAIRIVAGLALITLGLTLVHGVVGWVLVAVGLAPLLAGTLNVCLIAPLIGAPFWGADALSSPHNSAQLAK